MDPDHHRTPFVRGFRRRPDVQVQAIFAHWLGSGAIDGSLGIRQLHTSGAEVIGLANAIPVGRSLGSAPAQLADRRSRIGHTFEHHHARVRTGDAAERPLSTLTGTSRPPAKTSAGRKRMRRDTQIMLRASLHRDLSMQRRRRGIRTSHARLRRVVSKPSRDIHFSPVFDRDFG